MHRAYPYVPFTALFPACGGTSGRDLSACRGWRLRGQPRAFPPPTQPPPICFPPPAPAKAGRTMSEPPRGRKRRRAYRQTVSSCVSLAHHRLRIIGRERTAESREPENAAVIVADVRTTAIRVPWIDPPRLDRKSTRLNSSH